MFVVYGIAKYFIQLKNYSRCENKTMSWSLKLYWKVSVISYLLYKGVKYHGYKCIQSCCTDLALVFRLWCLFVPSLLLILLRFCTRHTGTQCSFTMNSDSQNSSSMVFKRSYFFVTTSQWRHNEHNGVSNHKPHDCFLNLLFRLRSNKTSKLRVTGLCVGWPVNSPHKGPVTRKIFPFDDVIMT